MGVKGLLYNKKLNLKICRIPIILSLLVLISLPLSASGRNSSEKSYNWFWFFYEHSLHEFGENRVYRPFYMNMDYKKGTFQASLMPFIFTRYKDDNYDRVRAFLGLYASDDYTHSDKKDDYDSGFFPLYLYGNGGKEKDRYFFLYPFGGTFKGKLGHDEISPYLFPGFLLFVFYPPSSLFTWQALAWGLLSLVPVYTEYNFKDYHAQAWFWPLIQRGKSENRDDFRFLPFYAHNSKDGWYDNYSYLLLINYRKTFFRDDVSYTFFFLPFYGRKWSDSGDVSATTILWPFFSWGYNKKRGETQYNLPWPLVQIMDSEKPEIRKRIFFPFYGRYSYNNYESFFVTPLYFRIKKETEFFSSAYYYNFIICWYFKREYKAEHDYYGNSWRYFKLWPLVQSEWSDNGLFAINILSLLPFRDTGGYEKLYQPFWTIFEYRKSPHGDKHLGILFRTYYQVWNDNYFKMKVPFIISYEKKNDKIRDFTILLSAFGYENEAAGTYIRFFWLPLKIGDGTGENDVADADVDKNIFFAGDEYNPYFGFNYNHSSLSDTGLSDKAFVKRNIF
jgi:hypothetical protein